MAVLPYNPYEDTSVVLVTADRRGQSITLPSVTSFKVSRSAQTTNMPIEQGSDIGIHRRRAPIEVSLSGVVTEIEPFDGVPSLFGYIAEVRSALEANYNNGILLTVRFLGRKFTNMEIGLFPDSQEASERADVWHYDLTFREVLIASTTTVLGGTSNLGSLTSATLEGGPQAGTSLGPEAAAQVGGILGGGL